MSAQKQTEILAVEIITEYSEDYHQRAHLTAADHWTVAECSVPICRKATEVIAAFSRKRA